MNISKVLNISRVNRQISAKESSIVKVRKIQKINYYINLPAFESLEVPKNGRLLFQFNLSLPSNFRLLDGVKLSNSLSKGVLTIKYRTDSEVFRYVIWGDLQRTIIDGETVDVYDYPDYKGEIIGKNCCFEYWSVQRTGIAVVRPNGIPSLKLKTSILTDPSDVNQIEIVKNADNSLQIIDLGSAFPEDIPTLQSNLAWLNNVI